MLLVKDSAHKKSLYTPRDEYKHVVLPCRWMQIFQTWSAFHGDVLILSENCVSMSWAISPMCSVTLLAERVTCAIFFHSSFFQQFTAYVFRKWQDKLSMDGE